MMFLTFAPNTSAFDAYKILDIDRVSVFAGRMGKEVRETWKVSKSGREFTVIVMPYHTNVAGTKSFATGDEVMIKSAARGSTIRVTLKEVSK